MPAYSSRHRIIGAGNTPAIGFKRGIGGVVMPTGKFLEWRDGEFYTDTGCTTLATSNGNNVKGMNDTTANNYDGTRSSNNPTYLTSQAGSWGGASFSGSNLPILSGSILNSSFDTALTAYFVVRNKDSGLLVLSATTSLGYYLSQQSHRTTFYTQANATTYYGPGEVYAPQIVGVRYNGTNVRLRTKSAAMHGYKDTSRTGNLGLTAVFGVGDLVATGYPYAGVSIHTALYNAAHTDAQMDAAFAFLAQRYSITEKTKQVVCWGDSLTWGGGAGLGSGYPEQLGTLLGSTWGVANCGFSSQTIGGMATYKTHDIQSVYDATKTKNIVIVWLGTNDINAGTSGATAYAAYKALCADLQSYGHYVIASTIIKRSTFDAAKEIERGVFNTALLAETLASSGAFNARINPGAHANLQNTADATYYTDGTHLTTAGYAIVAGLANTAVLAA